MRFDPGYYHHGFWLFGIIPFLMFLVLIGVGVWAVIRLTSRPPGSPMGGPHQGPATGGHPTPPMPRDPALEELRVRYARGELDREEFLQRSRDLGGPAGGTDAPPGGPPPPAAG